MNRIGQLVFSCAVLAALALYALTVPNGLPWNDSTHLALAYLGEIAPLPRMPHPIWGYYVQVFGSAVALSVSLAALAAGIVALLVNRHFGWRFAASAALTWTFLPAVWNRAVTGQRSICLAAMAVVAVWAAHGAAVRVLRKARAAMRAAKNVGSVDGDGFASPTTHDELLRRCKANRIAGWVAMGAASVFALMSYNFHDERTGEAASVFARGVVDAAEGRIIVMNGVCDDQVMRELKSSRPRQSAALPSTFNALTLRNDDAARTRLVATVKSAFPAETNLWVAAQVSAEAFADAAAAQHPDRFYLMNGKSTTLDQWEKRWQAFKPQLGSTDPFVPIARRLFGREANAVALAMGEKDESAWRLYKRVRDEVDPDNVSALINMNEMIRNGCAASGEEKKKVQKTMEKFFQDARNREHMREIVFSAGPVRTDADRMETLAAEAKKRIAERIAAGEKVEFSPEFLSLLEWNNEMVKLMDKGEIVKAGRIARAILTNPKWRRFIPANAVMGTVTAKEGDEVASEAFFRMATDTTNAVPAVVLNDFADVLMRRGKLDEAEKTARRAVDASDERFWIGRLTLAQILEKKVGNRRRVEIADGDETIERFVEIEGADKLKAEAKSLRKSVMAHAPAHVRERLREEGRRGGS